MFGWGLFGWCCQCSSDPESDSRSAPDTYKRALKARFASIHAAIDYESSRGNTVTIILIPQPSFKDAISSHFEAKGYTIVPFTDPKNGNCWKISCVPLEPSVAILKRENL
jgi:hypothetical protein